MAAKALEAPTSDDPSNTLDRAVSIRLAQEEVKSAESRLDECKISLEKVEARGTVLGIRGRLTAATRILREHKILLEWMDGNDE